MAYDVAIIPPVRTGTIESSIDFEYDHSNTTCFEATGTLEWNFDLGAYYELTGLDIGGDYPYVSQEGNYPLRIVTEYSWMHSDYNDKESYTLSIEEVAYSGNTRREFIHWTQNGGYDLDENMCVTRTYNDRQQYRYRTADVSVEHRDIPQLEGHIAYDGEQFVRKLHSGVLGPTNGQRLFDLLKADSPDNALTVEQYEGTEPIEQSPTATGD